MTDNELVQLGDDGFALEDDRLVLKDCGFALDGSSLAVCHSGDSWYTSAQLSLSCGSSASSQKDSTEDLVPNGSIGVR